LEVTGSIGILLKARQQGLTGSIADSIARLRAHGIWLGAQVQAFALKEEAKLTL
jgi:predicted nucleic acid-binding protein